ncbi:MAG TPA: hypothetical protein VGQ83_05715 [Polyangia bacterium]|jgi:hypothetical protein
MTIEVECYAGYKGEETPRRLIIGGHPLAVLDVIDRWLAPDHSYFKVRCDNGAIFIIRHDLESLEWELTMFEQPLDGRPSGV